MIKTNQMILMDIMVKHNIIEINKS
jgi:hypothetical protein